jgi:hypothetical protein
MIAAEEISRLEVINHIPALYTFYALMHPDAQAIIPRHVVIGWYREEFQARGPEPAISTGVTYKDWTWGVTGVTYPNTAEVSYTQDFADGTVVEDVVRLVYDMGAWKWFFGRDRAWVDEQIRRYTQSLTVPQQGVVPFGLEQVRPAEEMLSRLPASLDPIGTTAVLQTPEPGRMQLAEWAQSTSGRLYVSVPDRYPVGFAQVDTLRPDLSVAEALRIAAERYESAPPFTLHAWNLAPDNGVPFLSFETFGSDAVGHAQYVMWGEAAGDTIGIISHVDRAALETMAASFQHMPSA